ncbi:MAG: DUF1887 family CARF protein [Anaerolineales bacterium]
MTTLLSLIGEQPIPVLLADRALRPQRHLLAHSAETRPVAERLAALLPHAELLPLADPYDLAAIQAAFEQVHRPGMTFNLTSGTKPMAWAGYEVARGHQARIVYLQSEKKQSRLHQIDFREGRTQQKDEILPGLLTLEDYLAAHGLRIESRLSFSNAQEVALHKAIEPLVDECLPNLKFPAFEVDFLIRRGNQVAAIEAKDRQKSRRFGIDQLTTIAGREYLGAYTGRIWVVKNPPGDNLRELAQAYRIEVVPVTIEDHNTGRWRLTGPSCRALAAALDRVLGPAG